MLKQPQSLKIVFKIGMKEVAIQLNLSYFETKSQRSSWRLSVLGAFKIVLNKEFKNIPNFNFRNVYVVCVYSDKPKISK